jgi:hypothetical protein
MNEKDRGYVWTAGTDFKCHKVRVRAFSAKSAQSGA